MRIVFRGRVHGVPGDSNSVVVERGTVTWVGSGEPPDRAGEEIVVGLDELIAPGFIALEVNGFAGHDAADGADAIAAMSDALPSTGVTAFLPTLISAPIHV